jgi:hypothetical protein
VFGPDKIGAPAAGAPKAGRANPIGIPYLYVSDTKATVLAEIGPRPKGEITWMAEFRAKRKVWVIDLQKGRIRTPFIYSEKQLAKAYENQHVLELLSYELSRPVDRNNSHTASLEYLPTQYFCELVKQEGYLGVIYQSSRSKSGGRNIVIFQPDAAGYVSHKTIST